MDARRLLGRMCARHGLHMQDAIRLLPLIERALLSPHNVRDRILSLVDHNLARKATSQSRQEDPRLVQEDLDEEILFSVARVLHGWTPSPKLLELGRLLPDLFPPGFSFDDLEDQGGGSDHEPDPA